MDETFYSVNQICDLLHVTRRTVLNYIQSGSLRAVKVGGKWQISQAALTDFTRGGDPEQARQDTELLNLFHTLPPSRREAVLSLAKDLQDSSAGSRIQYLTPRERTALRDYRYITDPRKEQAENCLRDLVREQDEQETWEQTWGSTDPTLKAWALAETDGDAGEAAYLLSMTENEINRQLPPGQWFDSRTARPLTDSINRTQPEDAGTDPEAWAEIMDRAETLALNRLHLWQERQNRMEGSEAR